MKISLFKKLENIKTFVCLGLFGDYNMVVVNDWRYNYNRSIRHE